MALWTDDEGLVNIQYDGHMCIHEMLRRNDEEYIESQDWLEKNLPSVDVAHVNVDFFNCFMVNEHVRLMQEEYPNIKKIIVTKTSSNHRIPCYAVGFIGDISTRFKYDEHFAIIDSEDIHINQSTEIIIDESLFVLRPKIITNHHTRLLLADLANFYWARQDLSSYLEFPYTEGHVYKNWFLPINRSNGDITWDMFKNIVYKNLNIGN